ncbi:MAG: glycerophosphodiester phosphodiesterase, partial [Acidobacteriota bacterium]
MTRPQVVAHRGSSALHADNSWAAFEAAVADGADAIECDVQGTVDGELVIRHDLTIANRLVAECSAAEVEALEPGLIHLADLLAWARRVQINLLVEVKDP